MAQNRSEPRHWVIIPAAGIGSRMQADRPKQYLSLGDGTVLEQTLKAFLYCPRFESVCVGIAAHDSCWSELSVSADARVQSFPGGQERADTVLSGLEFLSGQASEDDWIWVHDAARPCLLDADLSNLFAKLDSQPDEGVLLAVPVYDTVKRASSDDRVSETIERAGLWRAQTPQIFRYTELKNALKVCRQDNMKVTDESSAMEYLGKQPSLVAAQGQNIKITRPGDLEHAMQESMSSKINSLPRVGSGFDVHAFEPGDQVVLGGVTIPHTKGLKAHSDGDVVLHALMDALLGALALGDIGHHFPDTDAEWKNANSRQLLRAVRAKVEVLGYRVGNVDLTVMREGTSSTLMSKPMAQSHSFREMTTTENSTAFARTLLPSLLPVTSNPESADKLVYHKTKRPFSYSALNVLGALEDSEKGRAILFRVGGSKTASQQNDRPLGSFPRMNSISELRKPDVVARLKETQRLLRQYGRLMVDDGLLSQ